ncbi:hypothetical protein [Methanobrevibacter sp. UBA337]|jgi:hypothetical protein|uniref:hypothetical protein n=1 Tax=Methanobrevibacter sp. UBA337 TaxID=1915480 RepID=UPI0039B85499
MTLKKIEKNAKEISGNHAVPFSDFFPDKFIIKHTKFTTLNEMLKVSKIEFKSVSDLKNNEKWDKFVKETTDFNNWDSMLSKAAGEYGLKRIMD